MKRPSSVSIKSGSPAENFSLLGDEFLRAAKILESGDAVKLPETVVFKVFTGLPAASPPKWINVHMPLFFCIAHAAELYLKGYISHLGAAPPAKRLPKNHPGLSLQISWWGHRLKELLEYSQSAGLGLTDEAVTILTDIGNANERFEFRFQDTGLAVNLPSVAKSISSIEDLRRRTALAALDF